MKKIAITLSIIVVVIVALVIFMPHASNAPAPVATEETVVEQATTSAAPTTPSASNTSSSSAKSYTKAEVATHATTASCWTIINGNVYDVTSWISQHPGGSQAIKGLCGIDGSAAFNGQHGGQPRPER